MRIAETITKAIDLFYIKPLRAFVPQQVFRYLACGALTAFLDTVWYYLIYHYIVRVQFVDLGFIVVSPHIAALCVVFPITFITGFWLNRNVAFHTSPIPHGKQLWRYALSVAGAILLNYLSMKILVEVCNLWPTPSKIVTTVISSVYSFLMAKFYTFRKA